MISKSLSGVFAASLLSLSLGLVGCESNGEHASGTHTMSDGTVMAGTSHAVMCGKCETVWIPTSTGTGKSTQLVSKKGMTCPSCDQMAAAYMKDGVKMLHNCPDCKVTPVELNAVAPSSPKGTHTNH